MTDEQVAEALHTYQCNASHIDQCDWDYYSWENPGYEHKYRLSQAKRLIKEHGRNRVLDMIDCHKQLTWELK